jgi:hypothetical protein
VDLGKLEFFYAAVIVAVLAALAGYFGWRQIHALRDLRTADHLSPEDRRYEYGKVWRRLAGSFLMIVLAVLFAGSYLLDFNERAVELGTHRAVDAETGKAPEMSPEQKRFVNFFSAYWSICVAVLLAILVLAAVDLWAIRRYGLRHYRQIQSDRRAMIEEQVALLRKERNGHV